MISDSSAARVLALGLRELANLVSEPADLQEAIDEFAKFSDKLLEKYSPESLATAILLSAADVLDGIADAFEGKEDENHSRH